MHLVFKLIFMPKGGANRISGNPSVKGILKQLNIVNISCFGWCHANMQHIISFLQSNFLGIIVIIGGSEYEIIRLNIKVLETDH